jgi:HEAT repeat protein
VALQVQQHQIIEVRTYVGGRWRESGTALDLGTVSAEAAARYFLKLAGQADEMEGDPVLPATLADSVTVWPALLRLARNTRIPEERRKSAVFWLSQAAEAAAGLALDSIVSDPGGTREIRKQAVFAMSQRDPDEAVPRLIHIAKTNPDPELRKTALFWLGQSEDPRAIDLFEEILQ